MMRHSRAIGARDAFTLIELLVVISIIALLVSILLPALARARESGKLVACAANLRAMGQGAVMYAMDHDGSLPPNFIPNQWAPYTLKRLSDRSESYNLGHLYDGHYITAPAAYYCPSQQEPSLMLDTPQNIWWPSHPSLTAHPAGGEWVRSSYYFWAREKIIGVAGPPNWSVSRRNLDDLQGGAFVADNVYHIDNVGWSHGQIQGYNVLHGDGSAKLWIDQNRVWLNLIVARGYPIVSDIYALFDLFDE